MYDVNIVLVHKRQVRESKWKMTDIYERSILEIHIEAGIMPDSLTCSADRTQRIQTA